MLPISDFHMWQNHVVVGGSFCSPVLLLQDRKSLVSVVFCRGLNSAGCQIRHLAMVRSAILYTISLVMRVILDHILVNLTSDKQTLLKLYQKMRSFIPQHATDCVWRLGCTRGLPVTLAGCKEKGEKEREE